MTRIRGWLDRAGGHAQTPSIGRAGGLSTRSEGTRATERRHITNDGYNSVDTAHGDGMEDGDPPERDSVTLPHVDKSDLPRVAFVPPRRGGPSWALMIPLWAIVFFLVWTIVRPSRPAPLHDPAFKSRPLAAPGELSPEENATIDVFRQAAPSVCYVTTIQHARSWFSPDLLAIPKGSGSGFVYDDEGHIVTNYHVIAGADALEVTLADQSKWNARVVGVDRDKDLAVIKIDAPRNQLEPIALGTARDLLVGQKVLAIGNPFGWDHTLTVGVVSALDRQIESVTGRKIRGVIQTDAAINPGNSGGPLLDGAGRLIGVNTQIASPSGASSGIGFAVPVDIVNEIVPDLIRFGEVRRLGLGIIPYEDWRVHRVGLEGVLVQTVSQDGPAQQAEMRGTSFDRRGSLTQLGDLIVAIDDHPVRNLNDLRDALEPHQLGDTVRVRFVRDKQTRTVKIALQYIN